MLRTGLHNIPIKLLHTCNVLCRVGLNTGLPSKISNKPFPNCFFLIEKLRESSRLTELAKQISKTQPKIVEITPREGVCRRLESDMQI